MSSTPYEVFRISLPSHTPDGEISTLIVTRQAGWERGRVVWLTLYGSWRGTVCLTDDEVDQLRQHLAMAKAARLGTGTRSSGPPTRDDV